MLRFDGICKVFNPGTPDAATVFDNFNLELGKGEFLSIVGSNGSGKTTLLNILCGSIPADSGRILLAGEDISRQKEHTRSAKMGRVFQDPSRGVCPSLTVLENMSLADNKGKPFGLSPGVEKSAGATISSSSNACIWVSKTGWGRRSARSPAASARPWRSCSLP